ncbi:MAG TPA: hypothetical protein VK453_15400 [Micromonosporaceae bacterium]|nr:hypothetical protein [Micromonosporaceae bacterium]
MRGPKTAAVLISIALLVTGCTEKPDPPDEAAQSSAVTVTPSTDPNLQQACSAVRKADDQSGAKVTALIQKAVDANAADAATRSALLTEIRATFKEWSAAMRAEAAKASDTNLQSVLNQYAAGVDARIDEVKGPDDLYKLYSAGDNPMTRAMASLDEICA